MLPTVTLCQTFAGKKWKEVALHPLLSSRPTGLPEAAQEEHLPLQKNTVAAGLDCCWIIAWKNVRVCMFVWSKNVICLYICGLRMCPDSTTPSYFAWSAGRGAAGKEGPALQLLSPPLAAALVEAWLEGLLPQVCLARPALLAISMLQTVPDLRRRKTQAWKEVALRSPLSARFAGPAGAAQKPGRSTYWEATPTVERLRRRWNCISLHSRACTCRYICGLRMCADSKCPSYVAVSGQTAGGAAAGGAGKEGPAPPALAAALAETCLGRTCCCDLLWRVLLAISTMLFSVTVSGAMLSVLRTGKRRTTWVWKEVARHSPLSAGPSGPA